MEFFAQLPKCLIGTEACASSHHCARELITQGHEMKPNQAIHDAVVDLNRERIPESIGHDKNLCLGRTIRPEGPTQRLA
jgi:hypothetical protein